MVLQQHVAAPARAPAKPSSRAKLAQEGKAPGQGGAMHYRAVFHLDGSPGVPMLDLKDVAKVCPLPLSHTLRMSCTESLRLMKRSAHGAMLP